MKELIKQFAVTAGGVLVAGAILLMNLGTSVQDSAQNLGGYLTATPITVATSSSAVAVTTSTRILATSTINVADGANQYSRRYATICNPSATLVYVNLDSDKPASLPNARFSHVIGAAEGYSACMEIHDPSYQGSVTASSTNQSSVTVYVKEYVQ